jgi:YD repeat-containing protein
MKQSTTTIVSNVSYNAANQLLSINYPTRTETRAYNTLDQLTNVTVQLPYSPYTYPENLTYNYPTGTNNGKASSMYNAVSGETVTYTYDSLNRLLTANGSGWGQQYGFDGFGNLLSKTVTAGSGPSLSVSVNAANNQSKACRA